MAVSSRVLPALLLCGLAACDVHSTPASCCTDGAPALRIVNAFTSPVDVLVDGQVAIASLAAGAIDTIGPASGGHTLVMRPTGSTASVSETVTTAAGALSTVAVLRSASGTIGTAVLDDTNSVVPAGATKVRVLHLAPNAGTLQVFRTQPDFGTPIAWQFPFEYQSAPTSLSAPFYQSTPGTWEIRIWKTPADASGWDTAPTKVTIDLQSGQKKTVLILDAAGGGVRVELI